MKNNKLILTIIIVISLVIVIVFAKVLVDKKENAGEKISITATFYPQYIALLNIIGDTSGVEYNLLNETNVGCLHNYSLTTADMKKLEDADVIVLNGAGMEEKMEDFLDTLDKKMIDASKDLETIQGEEEENPHTFLSNELYIKQIENITDELGKIDPENKTKYEENAEEYINKIKTLNDTAIEKFATITNKNIVTSHDTFAYFAKEYGFNVVAVLKGHEEDSVSAAHVKEIINIVNENNVKAVFVDEGKENSVATSIANDTDAKIYEITTITGGDLDKDAYINKMNEIISKFSEALSE